MNLEEVLSSIGDESIKEAVVSLINAEKERGIEAYRKKDKESMEWKNHAKDLGWDNTKYDNIDDWKNSLKTKDKKVSESNLTIAQLNDKLNTYMAELESERESSRQIQKKAKENKLQADLTSKIGNVFYGSDFMVKTLISEGIADIQDDQTIIKDGDRVLSLDEGINVLKEKYKDSLKVQQVAGSGDNGGTKVTPQKEKSFAEQMAERLKPK